MANDSLLIRSSDKLLLRAGDTLVLRTFTERGSDRVTELQVNALAGKVRTFSPKENPLGGQDNLLLLGVS